MTRGQRWMAVAVAMVAGLLAGCGDDDSAGDQAGTTLPDQSTESTTTSSEAPSSTSTSVDGSALPDEPPFHADRASGSGCTPGDGTLPDGWWYGSLDGPVTDEVTFDLACHYVGAAAEAEAASRGDEVLNDYYVVNENEALRTIPVAEDATARCVEMGAVVSEVECDPTEVDGSMWAVWLRVADGQVDRIVEQYAP